MERLLTLFDTYLIGIERSLWLIIQLVLCINVMTNGFLDYLILLSSFNGYHDRTAEALSPLEKNSMMGENLGLKIELFIENHNWIKFSKSAATHFNTGVCISDSMTKEEEKKSISRAAKYKM